jgi:hypothetical protein
MPSKLVILDDRFTTLGVAYERGIKRALGHAASATVSAARSGGTGDYNLGSITESIKATEVHRAKRGWRTFVFSEDFRAVFFERGTYNRRRGKLSPRYHRTARADRIAAERGSGVKAQHMLGHAVPTARRVLLREVQRELG